MNVRFRNDTGLIKDVLEVFRDFPVPGHSSLALERLCDAFERALERRGEPPAAPPTDAPALPVCLNCDAGFPVQDGVHYGTQRLGMISNTPCDAALPVKEPAK